MIHNYVKRQEQNAPSLDFSKIKVGMRTLEDATVAVNSFKRADKRLGDKHFVIEAISKQDLSAMREISDFFYRTSGIYSRLCRYAAYLYNYDWMITPYLNEEASETVEEKALDSFNKALIYFDNFGIKKFFGEVALKVIRYGCYYGYKIPQKEKMVIQELPANYCRSRMQVNGRPVVEFNMKFFDDYYRDTEQRIKILNLFPEEFKKGYLAYKQGKLTGLMPGDSAGWWVLDPNNTVKFNINGEDFPFFVAVIPAIIDLDEAQEIDREKAKQQILKLIIQKMPIDKNGEIIFDVEEAAELHQNAVQMIGKATGLKVLTTFADASVASLADRNTTTTSDDLAKVERAVYNEGGVSQLQFNTDSSAALSNSIANDEAALYNLIIQFEEFLNDMLLMFNKSPKKVYLRAQILKTTIYNYKELSKMYKEQMQVGFSKMLPQIALGQSQSSILANTHFENDVLDLVNKFIPPLMSSTMNADILARARGNRADAAPTSGDNSNAGRPEKDLSEKSEKTLANIESQ